MEWQERWERLSSVAVRQPPDLRQHKEATREKGPRDLDLPTTVGRQTCVGGQNHVGVLPNRAIHRYSKYQRVTNGSNPAHGEA
jgi:hypothetical protein